jgi:TIR domain-containing protein
MPTAMSSRPKRNASTPSSARPPALPTLFGGTLGAQTRVFISYRRQDTAAAAAHLHDSLAQRFGEEKIFRDVVTIEPGQDFRAVIDQAIGATSAFIALIGPRWLTVKGRDNKRRLDDPNDLVRVEIEAALRHGVSVIPVLVGGARMPPRKGLPASIAGLTARNALELPWHEGIARLERRIAQIERERAERDAALRAERERLDLTRGPGIMSAAGRSRSAKASYDVVIRAMEMSLAHQGHALSLESSDLWATMENMTGRPMDQGFVFDDLAYVIDFVGVKAKRSRARYIARSYPLASFEDIPAHLALGRPVLAGVLVYESWSREPSSKTGIIDLVEPDRIQGATVGAVVAWDPAKQELKLLTGWPKWGDHGILSLTRAAAARSIHQFRSIEAILMPKPPVNDRTLQGAEVSRPRDPKKSPKRSRAG